jgi:hypothetical protein
VPVPADKLIDDMVEVETEQDIVTTKYNKYIPAGVDANCPTLETPVLEVKENVVVCVNGAICPINVEPAVVDVPYVKYE